MVVVKLIVLSKEVKLLHKEEPAVLTLANLSTTDRNLKTVRSLFRSVLVRQGAQVAQNLECETIVLIMSGTQRLHALVFTKTGTRLVSMPPLVKLPTRPNSLDLEMVVGTVNVLPTWTLLGTLANRLLTSLILTIVNTLPLLLVALGKQWNCLLATPCPSSGYERRTPTAV